MKPGQNDAQRGVKRLVKVIKKRPERTILSLFISFVKNGFPKESGLKLRIGGETDGKWRTGQKVKNGTESEV